MGEIFAICHECGIAAFVRFVGVGASGGIGYLSGQGYRMAIDKAIGKPLGIWIHEQAHGPSADDGSNPSSDNPGTDRPNPRDPNWRSPDPVADPIVKLFCELNPGVPQCQNDEPNECK